MTTVTDPITTGTIAKRLGVPRSVVCYAIDRAQIEPVARAGLVRLFDPSQWPDIVRAVRAVRERQPREATR